MLTTVEAAMATPLTTIASFLVSNFGVTQAAASASVWQSLSLAQQSVWDFNALQTALTSQIPFRLVDALWLVRQMQALNAATYVQDIFIGTDSVTVGFAAFDGLSRMVHEGPCLLYTSPSPRDS